MEFFSFHKPELNLDAAKIDDTELDDKKAHKQEVKTDSTNVGESDLLKRLRSETGSDHVDAEKAMPVFGSEFNSKRYRDLLVKMYGFYQAFETATWNLDLGNNLVGHLGDSSDGNVDITQAFDWETRRKLSLLHADLLSLGFSEEEISTIPNCENFPKISSAADFIGVLYVLEGSTLGGSIISRHLTEKFGEAFPLRFFRSYGAQTGLMWKKFQSTARFLIDENNYPHVLKAAKETFTEMGAWLRK